MKYPSIITINICDGYKSTQRRRLGTNTNLQCVLIYGLSIYGMKILALLQFLLFAVHGKDMFENDYTQIEHSHLASAFSIGFLCKHVGMQFPSTLVHWQPWHLNCRRACCTDTKIPWTHTTLLER